MGTESVKVMRRTSVPPNSSPTTGFMTIPQMELSSSISPGIMSHRANHHERQPTCISFYESIAKLRFDCSVMHRNVL